MSIASPTFANTFNTHKKSQRSSTMCAKYPVAQYKTSSSALSASKLFLLSATSVHYPKPKLNNHMLCATAARLPK